jgi:hypothetical protein
MALHTGGCACRSIRYEIAAEPLLMAQCQCRDCQEQTGSGHASVIAFPSSAVTMTGTATRYQSTADSGKRKTRAFCPVCGTPLYVLLESMPDAFLVKAATLDDPTLFRPQMVLYTDRAQPWDRVDATLPSYARMPPANS